MRRIIDKICLIAFMALACSCSETFTYIYSTPDPVKMVFSADNGGTKAYVDYMSSHQINWSLGDCISLYDGTANRKFTLTDGANTTSATFEGVAIVDADHAALYPYSSSAQFSGTNISKVYLKPEQTAVSGGFDPECAIMTAYAAAGSNHLSFQNAVSYIKVGVEFPCSEIIFNAKDADIAGTMSLSNIDATPEAYVQTDWSSVVTLVPSPTQECIVPGTYLLAVAPAQLSNGFEIVFHGTDEKYYCRSTSKTPTLSRGDILNLGTFYDVAGDWNSISTALGEGTESDPYRIYTFNQLKAVAAKVAGGDYLYSHFKLMNDIYCCGGQLPSIGTSSYPFHGTFDGDGHSIYDFTFAVTAGSSYRYCGLLGVAEGATVKNLSLTCNETFLEAGSGDDDFGGICGRGKDLTISNCSLGGTVNIQRTSIYYTYQRLRFGSIVGSVIESTSGGSTVSDCTSSLAVVVDVVNGTVCLGSMIGNVYCQALTLSGCSFTGSIDVTSTPEYVLCGMVGNVLSDSPFVCTGCTEGGTVNITTRATVNYGGAAGRIHDNSDEGGMHTISGFVGQSTGTAVIYGDQVRVGGVVGQAHLKNLSIDRCRNLVPFNMDCGDYSLNSSASTLGGIIGYFYDAGNIDCEKFLISNCVNEGNLTLVDSDQAEPRACVGGIVGFSDSDGTGDYSPVIANVLNKGNIHLLGDDSSAGGLAGSTYSLDTHFYGCVSVGSITSDGSPYMGALVGANFGTFSNAGYGDLEKCYYTSSHAAVYGDGWKDGNEIYQVSSIFCNDLNPKLEEFFDRFTSFNGVPFSLAQWTGNWSSTYTSLNIVLN